MNSKYYRFLNTLTLKSLTPNLQASEAGAGFSRIVLKNVQTRQISSQSLLFHINTGWATQCCCHKTGYYSPEPSLSSPVISRYYGSTPPGATPPGATPPDTTPPGATPPANEEPEKKPSIYQRFKSMYRDYWYVLIPVHLVTSAVWFGGFYYLASSGVDIVSLLEKLNVSERLINPFRNGHSRTGYLAISYALYKIATPLRYTVTLGGTTVSINYLKRWGYIKPMPSTVKLKEMYEDKKKILNERGQSIKENMMHSLKPTERKKKP